jgi:hypothetical protein
MARYFQSWFTNTNFDHRVRRFFPSQIFSDVELNQPALNIFLGSLLVGSQWHPKHGQHMHGSLWDVWRWVIALSHLTARLYSKNCFG